MDALSGDALDARLRAFLDEDLGGRDVTTEATVPARARARGRLLAKRPCVVAGLAAARRTFELLDPALDWQDEAAAGVSIAAGGSLASLSGRARALLTAERVAL